MSTPAGEPREKITTVRFPPELYADIKELAAWHGRSAHNLIIFYARQGAEEDMKRRAAGERP